MGCKEPRGAGGAAAAASQGRLGPRSSVLHEGASIPELAEELGHSPHMTLTTYAHVIHELRGAPRLPAAEEVAKARREVNQGGPQLALAEALG